MLDCGKIRLFLINESESKGKRKVLDSLSEREEDILMLFMDNPRLTVPEIAQLTKVSEVTVRHDLKEMEAEGVIIRAHGSGMPAFHPAMLARQMKNRDAKLAIAKVAAEMILPGDKIMLVGGTTTSLVPRFLYGKSGIKIVTNSTSLLPYVRTNPGIQVIFTGGDFRPEAEVMVGPTTLREISQFHVPTAFVGTDGMILDKGLTANSVEIAETVRVMAEHSDRQVLLSDSSKVGRSGFAAIMPLENVDTFVTDDNLPPDAALAIREKGVKLVLVHVGKNDSTEKQEGA